MIFFSVLHPRKVESPNSVIEFPKITEDSFSQFLNVEEPMVSTLSGRMMSVNAIQFSYLQPIITQYFIGNKSEIWSLSLIVHSKG